MSHLQTSTLLLIVSDHATGTQVKLVDYSVNRVSEGIDALATTRVAIRPDGRMASEGFVTSYKVLQVSGLRSTLLPGHC